MLVQLEAILNNILQFGINSNELEKLQKVAIENEGIFGVVSEKRDLIVKFGDITQVLSLLQLITAIKVTMSKIDGQIELKQLEPLISANKTPILIQTSNQLELKLNNLIELSPKELVSKLVNTDYYYGQDRFIGNKEFYRLLIEGARLQCGRRTRYRR